MPSAIIAVFIINPAYNSDLYAFKNDLQVMWRGGGGAGRQRQCQFVLIYNKYLIFFFAHSWCLFKFSHEGEGWWEVQ